MENKIPYSFLDVIVTTTYFCNMNCVYCYNTRNKHDIKEKIDLDTVKRLFEITIPFYKEIHFLWHGGEALTLGLDFYREVIRLQKMVNCNDAIVTNSIQTNLTLMNDETARFLGENGFKIGSSFDGTTNEKTRHNSKSILAGYETIKHAGGHNGFICVVQSENIEHLMEDYAWFKANNINYTLNMYLQDEDRKDDPLTVAPEVFSNRMSELFDVWLYDRECNISVSYFEMFLEYFLLREKHLCIYNSCIGKHIGVRYDGTIYGCNRYFPKEFCYGNVWDIDNIKDAFNSDGCNKLLKEAIERRRKCQNCAVFDFCEGGCNSVALHNGHISNQNENFCKSVILMYQHCESEISKLKNSSLEKIDAILNPRASYFFHERSRRILKGSHIDFHTDEA